MIDLTGKKFGRLSVLRREGKKYGRPAWFCRCSCGKEIIVASANLRRGNTKSCGCLNKERVSAARKNKPRSEETKRKISESKKGKKRMSFSKSWLASLSKAARNRTWSDEVKKKMSLSKLGNKNPNYNPKLTYEDRLRGRRYFEYYRWRKAVFERDKYTCRICNCFGGSLNAHHIENYEANFNLRLELKNGVTLCKNCHKKFHRKYGRKNNTADQLKEFAQLSKGKYTIM